ncbi:helix-turn-helix domain-containing protein [Paenibacillus spongiae]|uniref:Helix-turn-helix domain-containing protein n=1 Tax=Paenibacillus spongiae TaxID=2909671 RepID=A0ABY5SHH5_9BACL|nr:helix-turn-helix domain-containing protein [Paenibacillus spongiae]UVI33038.1 helix-turn-helix domain-containing protein [Paenibacillus spongiae]
MKSKTSWELGERMSGIESVQRAIDYIEDHLEEEMDLSAIADEAYISVAQLYRVFYALTGHPVKEYIRKRRMSVAANHLRNSNQSVEELAWCSGFESYHSFAKVFKKIVGVTPAAYRNADFFYSFEPIRLHERVVYLEDREQTELFPDVKVIRLLPDKMHAYLHVSKQEAGMEHEAYRIVFEKLGLHEKMRGSKPKLRIFGTNVDLPDEDGEPRFGYRVLIAHLADGEEWTREGTFTEEPFPGGLYAVRKIAASPPEVVQDGWDRLLSEWLPKSTFEIGTHPYIEEFIAYNGKITRMNLFLPVQRKYRNEPIEVVELPDMQAFFSRGYGAMAQASAERQLIEWFTNASDSGRLAGQGKYYMSFHYGCSDSDEYWWENGLLARESDLLEAERLNRKRFGSGIYACCVSKTYGLLSGVLDQMHRWIATNDTYELDGTRQWFAEYHTFDGMNVERDTIVKVYIPVK